MTREYGITLLELMVTIVIAVILMMVAVPGFNSYIRDSSLASITNNLLSTLNVARSEAIKRGVPISLCRSNDNASCSGAWSDGWIVFADLDRDGVVDTGESLLQAGEGVPGASYSVAVTLADRAGSAKTYVLFTARGVTAHTGRVAVCHLNDVASARVIALSATHARVDKGAAILDCGAP